MSIPPSLPSPHPAFHFEKNNRQSEYDDHATRIAARESSKGKDPIATIKVTVEALRKLQASKNKTWLLTRRSAAEKRREVATEPKKNDPTKETMINNKFDPFAFAVDSSCDTDQS